MIQCSMSEVEIRVLKDVDRIQSNFSLPYGYGTKVRMGYTISWTSESRRTVGHSLVTSMRVGFPIFDDLHLSVCELIDVASLGLSLEGVTNGWLKVGFGVYGSCGRLVRFFSARCRHSFNDF